MTYNLDGERAFIAKLDFEDAAFVAVTDQAAPFNRLWVKTAPSQGRVLEVLPAMEWWRCNAVGKEGERLICWRRRSHHVFG